MNQQTFLTSPGKLKQMLSCAPICWGVAGGRRSDIAVLKNRNVAMRPCEYYSTAIQWMTSLGVSQRFYQKLDSLESMSLCLTKQLSLRPYLASCQMCRFASEWSFKLSGMSFKCSRVRVCETADELQHKLWPNLHVKLKPFCHTWQCLCG